MIGVVGHIAETGSVAFVAMEPDAWPRWLILAGHEMADTGPQATSLKTLEALGRYVKDPANGIWVDTVGAAARFVMEHRRPSPDAEPEP